MARELEFWQRLSDEADRRRRLRTPTYLEGRIMKALPHTGPRSMSPWWRREFAVTPASAVTAAAMLVILSAALTALVVRALH